MVYLADKYGRTDGTAHNMLLMFPSDITFVLVSRVEDFVFNDALIGLNNYVLVCFVEYLWNWDRKETHIWGSNTDKFIERLGGGEWDKFDQFIKDNPPKLTLKRELLKDAVTENLLPIEYPCIITVPDPQTKEEYLSRPLSTFFYWGRSHEARVALHSKIWANSSFDGYSVCDNLYYFNKFLTEEKSEKWASMYIPHYGRVDIQNILGVNNLSKVSISMAGSGFKCFRHGEAPVNSLMAMERSNFAWTFDWDESNSIQFQVGKEIETIIEELKSDSLYERYVNGVNNCNNYQIDRYISHIEKLIRERI
jgi:hypothetical protein